MNGTPTSTASQSANRTKPASATPHAPPSRTPTDNGRQSALFQRELNRLDNPAPEKEGEDVKEAGQAKKPAKGIIDEREQRKGGEDSGDRQSGELPADPRIAALFRTAKVNATQAPTASELPAEHLARIAAAIQELVSSGATANYQLQLPVGNAMLQGAVLGRDAGGNLAIQLIASATLSPQDASQLRNELMRRMEQRRLKVASVAVSTTSGDTAPNASNPVAPPLLQRHDGKPPQG